MIATIQATMEDAAEIRYRMALRLEKLVVTSRISGQQYTWLVRVA